MAPPSPSVEKEEKSREERLRAGGGRAESLGWLTESTVMPKKHKAIEGVGAGSIVELKAQLYRTQEEARKAKDSEPSSSASSAADAFRARKRAAAAPDLFSQKNSGVDTRAHKDKLELKAIKDGSVSYAALEKKAALYEKLSRGELPDEEDSEKYCVDFFQKSMESDRFQPSDSWHDDNACGVDPPLRAGDGDGDAEDASDAFLSSRPFGLGRAGSTVDRDEHKRFVREVHEEVNLAREKASTIKMRRQEQEAARREKLRQAYLKKQLDKLLSSKQAAANDSGSTAG